MLQHLLRDKSCIVVAKRRRRKTATSKKGLHFFFPLICEGSALYQLQQQQKGKAFRQTVHKRCGTQLMKTPKRTQTNVPVMQITTTVSLLHSFFFPSSLDVLLRH